MKDNNSYITDLEKENESLRSAHSTLINSVNVLKNTCKELTAKLSLYERGTTEIDASVITHHVRPPSYDRDLRFKEVVICPLCLTASRWSDNLDIDKSCRYCGKETHIGYSNLKKYMARWEEVEHKTISFKRHWIFWKKEVSVKENSYRWRFSWET